MKRHFKWDWYVVAAIFVLYTSASLWVVHKLEQLLSPVIFYVDRSFR